jgi:predicted O-methyltransferase YrrM
MQYDKIAISSSVWFDEIKGQLVERYHADRNKIIYIGDIMIPSLCDMGSVSMKCESNTAYDFKDISYGQFIKSNRFEEFALSDHHRILFKYMHYFEVYEQYFSRYCNRPIRMLEIGVFKGGSIQMWKNYFPKGSQIVGIDIDKKCKRFEEDGVAIRIGSQEDADFLKSVNDEFGPFDIVLDDGSHIMEHQIASFECLFPLIAEDGVYMCEDTHTSYWAAYGGGLYKPDTFIEYSKDLVDEVNYGNMDDRTKSRHSQFQGMIKAIHYYDSMVVVEKKTKGLGFSFMTGTQL